MKSPKKSINLGKMEVTGAVSVSLLAADSVSFVSVPRTGAMGTGGGVRDWERRSKPWMLVLANGPL